jgi:hypothetical protein
MMDLYDLFVSVRPDQIINIVTDAGKMRGYALHLIGVTVNIMSREVLELQPKGDELYIWLGGYAS